MQLPIEIETLSIILFVGSFILSYYTIAKIKDVVLYKRLMDHPDERSSHTTKTPTLAGASFFSVLIFALYVIQGYDLHGISLSIIVGLTILLFIGLKDDLVVISAWMKILGQAAAIGILLLNGNFIIINLNGFLEIYELPYLLAVFLSGFLMLIIINAYNLIDGIDGLAAMIGIIIFTVFSVIFYLTNHYFFM